MTHDAAPAP